jgi:hypothetical protein
MVNESGMDEDRGYSYIAAKPQSSVSVTVCFMLSGVNGLTQDDIWVNISTQDDSAMG